MTAVAEQTGVWLTEFTQQPGAEPWIQKLREDAFERFAQVGFPTTRDEEWRFTNVAPIARSKFAMQAVAESAECNITEEAKPHLAQHADIKANAFVALNTAFLQDVQFVRVPRGKLVEQPIELIFHCNPGQAHHPRTLIVVGAGAQCTVIETYEGDGAYFTNAVTEFVVGDGAVVDHYKVQRESLEAFHVATMQAAVGRSANFSSHSISLGGALVRNDANAILSEGTEVTLNGLYIVNGTQHIDNHTILDHAKPHGASHEMYKGILDGRATAVFNGRIIVRKDAQKTDSKQTNKNLVLSDNAVINTKPELQIHADDVRCTHGATIGQLDSEALFYLQSRGIPKSEARSLLTYAFAQDIIDRIKVQPLRASLERMLFEKLNAR
jgi:Fe-S cluster assembly protein SufD